MSHGNFNPGSHPVPELQPTCSVVLKAELPSVERELLRRYCHEIHGHDGSTLLHFLCTRIDLSHPTYLEMQTFAPKSASTTSIRVPHVYVLLIDGGAKQPDTGLISSPPLLGT